LRDVGDPPKDRSEHELEGAAISGDLPALACDAVVYAVFLEEYVQDLAV
jgi:hypothetical protein